MAGERATTISEWLSVRRVEGSWRRRLRPANPLRPSSGSIRDGSLFSQTCIDCCRSALLERPFAGGFPPGCCRARRSFRWWRSKLMRAPFLLRTESLNLLAQRSHIDCVSALALTATRPAIGRRYRAWNTSCSMGGCFVRSLLNQVRWNPAPFRPLCVQVQAEHGKHTVQNDINEEFIGDPCEFLVRCSIVHAFGYLDCGLLGSTFFVTRISPGIE